MIIIIVCCVLFLYTDKNTCGDIVCDPNAECSNTGDQYFCTCSEGYIGNGRVCSRGENSDAKAGY